MIPAQLNVQSAVPSTSPTTVSLPPVVLSSCYRTEATMVSRLPSLYVCRNPDGPTLRPLYAELESPADALAEDRSGQTARFERLSRVRAQIAAGTYRVSAASLADALIHKLRSGSILR